MTKILWLDFETRSHCDLTTQGAYNYARHPTTELICMAYAFGDEDVRIWTPATPFPESVAMHQGQIRAHNAAFERLIQSRPDCRLVLYPEFNHWFPEQHSAVVLPEVRAFVGRAGNWTKRPE